MKTALIILAVLLGVLIILLLLICGFTFNQIIWYKQIPLPKFIGRLIAGNESPQSDYDRDRDAALKAFADFPIEKLSLTASNGEILRGSVITPPNTNGKLLIACHGAHSSGIGEFCFAMPYFYREGYTVLMPEHRGCGESDGKFLGYGTHESKDTLLWLEYARKRFPELNIYLYGVSMGGATVLMMSDKINDPAVKGVIADCSYTSAWDEFSYQLTKRIIDNAAVIELPYNDIVPNFEITSDYEPLNLNNDFFEADYITIADCKEEHDYITVLCSEYKAINNTVKYVNSQISHRTMQSIVFFSLYNREYELIESSHATDFIIFSHILPRIDGSGMYMKSVLSSVFKVCMKYDDSSYDINPDSSVRMHKAASGSSCRYKKSAVKLSQMMRGYEEYGFASYWNKQC